MEQNHNSDSNSDRATLEVVKQPLVIAKKRSRSTTITLRASLVKSSKADLYLSEFEDGDTLPTISELVELRTDSEDIKKQLADNEQQARALVKLESAELAVDAIEVKMEKMEHKLRIKNSTLNACPSLTDEAICIVWATNRAGEMVHQLEMSIVPSPKRTRRSGQGKRWHWGNSESEGDVDNDVCKNKAKKAKKGTK
jgi:hypothetical protein